MNIKTQSSNRLRELDFLRGIAIILVILNHQYLFEFSQNMGWIGVDLFFVLSGFLVSGLLFKEYIKYGNIKPFLFLIRRGFKIYPIFFIFYFVYLYIKLLKHDFLLRGVFFDLIFVQNYFCDWSYAFPPSWSLAIEEHFYIGFTFLLFLAIKKKWFVPKEMANNNKIYRLEMTILLIFGLCLTLRFLTNLYYPENKVQNITMTHLRIDSLLAGVLVSYWYYFRNDWLKSFYLSNKKILLSVAVLLVMFTPFIDRLNSFFIKTIGFSCLYVSFSILLISFIFEPNINLKLNRYLSKLVVDLVSKIGFCSYSIYIIHSAVIYFFSPENLPIFNKVINTKIIFVIVFTACIVIGLLMTTYIEKYFLQIRKKYFPSRII